jgi:thiol-disulfide isomerase/thioredoxin
MSAHRNLIRVLLLACLPALPAAGLELGDPAPPLKVAEWIKGGPVDLKAGAGKQVFVVEFWATWCGPCVMSIPHITELQRKFRNQGVVFIGLSTDSAQTKARVKSFVKDRGDQMDYAIALDDRGATQAAYMMPFGLRGIPHAFVIDKAGALVWHGHPMGGVLEKVVSDVVAGRHNAAQVRRAAAAQKLVTEYYNVAREGHSEKAAQIGGRILEEAKDSKELLGQLAYTIIKAPGIEKPDYGLAMRAAQAAYQLDAKDPRVAATYALAHHRAGKPEDAVKFMNQAIELCSASETQLRSALEQELVEIKRDQKWVGKN